MTSVRESNATLLTEHSQLVTTGLVVLFFGCVKRAFLASFKRDAAEIFFSTRNSFSKNRELVNHLTSVIAEKMLDNYRTINHFLRAKPYITRHESRLIVCARKIFFRGYSIGSLKSITREVDTMDEEEKPLDGFAF